MHGLIISVLAIFLSSLFLLSTMNFTSNNIEIKERELYKNAYENLVELNEQYIKYENKPLPITNWEKELSKYGKLPLLPSKNLISYNYSSSNKSYYFCITRLNPEKISHYAMSGLRSGFPRKYNDVLGVYELTSSQGYDSSIFNINTSCGSNNDYSVEPIETESYNTALSSTMWLGNLERFYKKNSINIKEDFSNLKSAFDKYVTINGSAPVVSSIDNVFSQLRPYGKIPNIYENYQWSYNIASGSNYFCLSTISTSSMTAVEREIHAKSLYDIGNYFDNSYFKINRTSCGNSSQSISTDYTSEISVYASYLLN